MDPFQIKKANGNKIPVIASIPHTGTFVPDEISELFISDAVRQLPMTDWYLHELYDFLPELGVCVISANYSRYVVDLNRSPVPLELYPGRFETKLVADSDFQGNSIFSEYPSNEKIELYKKTIHQPYHSALNQLLQETKKEFGKAYLFDLHSIAKHATRVHDELDKDIYLGDRDGQSCSREWTETVKNNYLEQNFSVQKNNPYKGGYITHHYGQNVDVQAIQIEMNQEVYMEKVNGALESEKFQIAKRRLKLLFEILLENLE